jgi:nucleotide-binding universal stress UspA family protein
MYRTILAAVNEHVNSEIAARYAKQVALAAGARLLLCSVRERGQTDRSFEQARMVAQRLQKRAREQDIQAESLFDSGDPVRRIGDLVRSERADLVFAATRREDVQHRFYAGRTTARRLLHQLSCAVAVVRVVHLGRTHPSEILVPLKARIDLIPERAEFTALLAKAFNAHTHLFHVTRPITKFFHGEKHLTPLEWEERLPPDIARFIGHLEGYGISHEKQVAPGRTGRSIAIEAAARRRDLIVMGASERGLLEHLLRGAPVEEVLRETTCNLIIFKPGT